MTRRRKRREPARCGDCKTPIKWARLRGAWRMFDPKRLDGQQHAAVAYPVENGGSHAEPFTDLVEDLMGRLGCTRSEAEDHVYAMPWHALHACPHEPDKD